jgi:hypothetical protein
MLVASGFGDGISELVAWEGKHYKTGERGRHLPTQFCSFPSPKASASRLFDSDARELCYVSQLRGRCWCF